jgi:hypothetical protein
MDQNVKDRTSFRESSVTPTSFGVSSVTPQEKDSELKEEILEEETKNEEVKDEENLEVFKSPSFGEVLKKDARPSPPLTRRRKSSQDRREKEVESNILAGNY